MNILLYDMKAVMSLGMIVDTMTNIWDIWYIGRSHLLTQGLSHALLTYRIMAIFLLSDLIQQTLLYVNRLSQSRDADLFQFALPGLLDRSMGLSPCCRTFDSNRVLCLLSHASYFKGVSHLDHVMVYRD